MNAYLMFFIVSAVMFTTMVERANQAYIGAIKARLNTGMQIAKDTSKQVDELAHAQAMYFKIYKTYPTSINDIIGKGLLRSNFKSSGYSKGVVLNSTTHEISASSNNQIVNSYLNGNAARLKARHQKMLLQNSGAIPNNMSATQIERMLDNL